jgi:hypothetical protein
MAQLALLLIPLGNNSSVLLHNQPHLASVSFAPVQDKSTNRIICIRPKHTTPATYLTASKRNPVQETWVPVPGQQRKKRLLSKRVEISARQFKRCASQTCYSPMPYE